MVRDGRGGDLVEVALALVVNPVLAQQDGDGGGGGAVRAVGRGEDVLGGDESAATPGMAATSRDQGHLPRVLVHLRLLASHDPVGRVGHTAGAGARSTCGGAAARGLGSGGGAGGGGGGLNTQVVHVNVTPEPASGLLLVALELKAQCVPHHWQLHPEPVGNGAVETEHHIASSDLQSVAFLQVES